MTHILSIFRRENSSYLSEEKEILSYKRATGTTSLWASREGMGCIREGSRKQMNCPQKVKVTTLSDKKINTGLELGCLQHYLQVCLVCCRTRGRASYKLCFCGKKDRGGVLFGDEFYISVGYTKASFQSSNLLYCLAF